MPGESPSCQKISSWPDKSEESKCSVPPSQNKHLSPFQDHPHTPKGVAFEKLKDLYQRLKYPTEGKYTQNIFTNVES